MDTEAAIATPSSISMTTVDDRPPPAERASQIALNKLKRTAAQHLPDYASFRGFFADADRPENVDLYKSYLRPHLDETTRAYWDGRDWSGRRRISGFATGFYRRGLLGRLIGFAHFLGRMYRIDPGEILKARTREEQRAIFETRYAPFFEKKFLRWLVDQPAALFGFGIPPVQYDLLKADDAQGITGALKSRLRKLACDFDLKDNYFAWQAFGRRYATNERAPLPPYLQREAFARLRKRASDMTVVHASLTEHLASKPARSHTVPSHDFFASFHCDVRWAPTYEAGAEASDHYPLIAEWT